MVSLDEFPRISRVKKENSEKFRFVTFNDRGEIKKTASSENLQNHEENDKRNILEKPKQKILKKCHFSRIEKEFLGNQYRKALILIPRNQLSDGITSY